MSSRLTSVHPCVINQSLSYVVSNMSTLHYLSAALAHNNTQQTGFGGWR